jgi:hypothetical protein
MFVQRSRSNGFEKPNYFGDDTSHESVRKEVRKGDDLTLQRLPKESNILLQCDTTLHMIDDTKVTRNDNGMLSERNDIEVGDTLKLTQNSSRKRKCETVQTQKKKPVYRKVLTIADLKNMSQESNTISDDSQEEENDELDAKPKATNKLKKDRSDKENHQNDVNSPSMPILRSPRKETSNPNLNKGLHEQMGITAKLTGIRKLNPKVKESLVDMDGENDNTEPDGDNNTALNVADEDFEKVIPLLRVSLSSKRGKPKIKKRGTSVATRKSKRIMEIKLAANYVVSYTDNDTISKDFEVNSAKPKVERRSQRHTVASKKGIELEKEDVMAHSGSEVTQSDVVVALCGVEVARRGAAVAHSDVEVGHSNAELAHRDAEVAHSGVEVARSDMEVAHSGAELAHSDVEVARSDVEVARSDVEVARSDMEVAHSGAELAHSGVEIAHSDCKEEEIIAGNLLEYSSSEASQFM